MSRHRRRQRSLSAYVDGELSASGTRQLEEHLASCRTCRAELENLQGLRGVLHHYFEDTRSVDPPPVWPGVRTRIEGGRPSRSLTTWIRGIGEAVWERPRLSFAAATVVAVVILSAGIVVWQTPMGPPPPQTASVEPAMEGAVVQAVEPEPGFRAMILTTSGRGLKVIWVVARGDL